jgi:hypothetical protein
MWPKGGKNYACMLKEANFLSRVMAQSFGEKSGPAGKAGRI